MCEKNGQRFSYRGEAITIVCGDSKTNPPRRWGVMAKRAGGGLHGCHVESVQAHPLYVLKVCDKAAEQINALVEKNSQNERWYISGHMTPKELIARARRQENL